MASKKEEERLKLFDTFAKNLNITTNNHSHIFFCPICGETFTRDQIDTKLSLAHVWPESLGGRLKTLACKECNNNVIGAKIEHHLINYAKLLRADKHHFKANLKDKEGRFTGYLKFAATEKGEPLFDIEVDSENSNPKVLSHFMETNDNNLPTINFELNLKFIERRISLAYLHFAYLYLFHHFGYDWMQLYLTIPIRAQLSNPEKEVFNPIIFAVSDDVPEEIATNLSEPFFLTIMFQPRSLISFVVVAPRLSPHAPRVAVVFPISNSSSFLPSDLLDAKISIPLENTHDHLTQPVAKHLCGRVLFDTLKRYGVVGNLEDFKTLITKKANNE